MECYTNVSSLGEDGHYETANKVQFMLNVTVDDKDAPVDKGREVFEALYQNRFKFK